jgi:L-lactate dehydrogenase complex protein LldG
MFEKFKARAEAVGSEVYRFGTRTEAQELLGVADSPKAYALSTESIFSGVLNRKGFEEDLPGFKFEITRQLAADSLVGITEMAYALADTGSLVADQTSIEERLLSTLAEIHIAIIGTDRILDGKTSVFQKINPSNSKYIAFITGPSRTADIERVLTIGVHGPKRLVIIFIDELGGSR